MRILSFIQKTIGLSRRRAFDAIKEGKVRCNAMRIEDSKHQLIAGDQVAIDGEKKVWTFQGETGIAAEQTVVCFHKPTGYVVSKNDRHNATIYEILPNEYRDYYYIGRLDKESEGLLLLTDTSELVNKLQHPSYDWKKVYVVTVHKPWEDSDSKRILKGFHVNDNARKVYKDTEGADFLRCVDIKVKSQDRKVVVVTLKEGKKRHVRRLLRAVGYHVERLQRIQFGPFFLEGIDGGKHTVHTEDFLTKFATT